MNPESDKAGEDLLADAGLLVRLLGPVEFCANGVPVPIGQPGLKVLLAVLALSAGRVVPTATLVRAIWGGEEQPWPRERERNLHWRVSQLRRVLAAAERDSGLSRLETAPPGYRLLLSRAELDVALFRRDVAEARAMLRAGEPWPALVLFNQGLDLWRGEALADVAALSRVLEAEGAALAEERVAASEDWADAMLATGRQREAAAELANLVTEHPLRERLHGQLMIALYQSGRQADALAVYQRARRRLAEELGIDPGPDLQNLLQRVLRADPTLESGAAGLGVPGIVREGRGAQEVAGADRAGEPGTKPGSWRSGSDPADGVRSGGGGPAPRQLPPGTRYFAGREAELGELDALLGGGAELGRVAVVTAIGGAGGVGKTALALHCAHRVADRFPDGQLYVNLRGFDPSGTPVSAAEAIRGFLDGLGVPPDRVPANAQAQHGLYRSMVADRRLLILADNARDASQVRPLLPASAGSLVLVTSRDTLTGLAAADGARLIRLGLLSEDDACRLLGARVGAARVVRERHAADSLIAGCGRLPLALAIAAARAASSPGLSLAAIAADMAGAGTGQPNGSSSTLQASTGRPSPAFSDPLSSSAHSRTPGPIRLKSCTAWATLTARSGTCPQLATPGSRQSPRWSTTTTLTPSGSVTSSPRRCRTGCLPAARYRYLAVVTGSPFTC